MYVTIWYFSLLKDIYHHIYLKLITFRCLFPFLDDHKSRWPFLISQRLFFSFNSTINTYWHHILLWVDRAYLSIFTIKTSCDPSISPYWIKSSDQDPPSSTSPPYRDIWYACTSPPTGRCAPSSRGPSPPLSSLRSCKGSCSPPARTASLAGRGAWMSASVFWYLDTDCSHILGPVLSNHRLDQIEHIIFFPSFKYGIFFF